MTTTKISALYKGFLANWPKSAGPKVTEANLIEAGLACAQINKAAGGVEFLAVAMYLRRNNKGVHYGATVGQVQAGCRSGAACSVYGRLNNANITTAVNMPKRVDVKGGQAHKVYALALTKPATKAPKAPKAPKPKATKPAPTTAPVADTK